MFCNNCGTKLDDNATFCSNCGSKIENDEGKKDEEKAETVVPTEPVKENIVHESQAPLVLGIISILTSAIFIISLPLAIVGLVQYKKNKKANPNYSVAGKVLSIIGMVLTILTTILTVAMIWIGILAYNDTKDNNDIPENTKDYSISTEEKHTRVGEEDYGFIDIPKDWTKYNPVTENGVTLYQYSNVDQDEVITMSKYDATAISFDQVLENLNNSLKDDNVENLKIKEENISAYSATSMSCYYSSKNVYVKIWIFEDYSDVIHYIAIESSDEESEIFDLIDSYNLYY